MATGGVNATSKRESLTCALCLDIYTSPKLLPCYHTFCEKCLKDLASKHLYNRFPCPSCRKETAVPPGGVTAFQANFYIDTEDLESARKNTVCTIHPTKELEFFCVQCEESICLNCKLTEHEIHQTWDLTKAASIAETQLLKDNDRLKRMVDDVKTTVEQAKKEQRAVKYKKVAVQQDIHNRHATLQAAIDKYRDDALASLDTVTDDLLAVLQVDLFCRRENLQELNKLQQRVQQALDSGSGCELVTVAREMRCGRGSEEAVQKLTTKPMTTVCRPVLHFSATADVTLQRMRDYMGSAAKMEMAASAPEVTVAEQFRCGEDPDADVYHVCPLTDGKVWISYEPHVMHSLVANAELFDTKGNVVYTQSLDPPSRLTYARNKNGLEMYPTPSEDLFSTYAKKTDPELEQFIRLNHNYEETSYVVFLRVISENPFKTERKIKCTINSTLHRAFDVDASEQNFVVLQEAQTPHTQRTVRLYRHSQPDAIHTYSPPVQPFQPSDVCFYRLGGQEVLLVADELNDAIHVVKVQDGRLSFARYLAPGCPLLVQPTALNTDIDGRLWVACRGGRILTCTPKKLNRLSHMGGIKVLPMYVHLEERWLPSLTWQGEVEV